MAVKPIEHSFNVEIAETYGVYEAIVLKNILFWVEKNAANGKHCHDGHYWTYNSTKAFKQLFPYFSEKQIRTILGKLEKAGLILTGNYNKSAYDRTKWYAVTEKTLALYGMENSICPNGKMENPERENENAQEGEPIPDGKPVAKPYVKPNEKREGAEAPKPRTKFVPPTLEEVREFISANHYNVIPEKWYYHYEGNGWMVGRTKMKDWQAAVRTWQYSDFNQDKKQANQPQLQLIPHTAEEEKDEWGW